MQWTEFVPREQKYLREAAPVGDSPAVEMATEEEDLDDFDEDDFDDDFDDDFEEELEDEYDIEDDFADVPGSDGDFDNEADDGTEEETAGGGITN